MSLTKRRLQFLGRLVELYQRTRLPIHYETLAKSLGVSKWTAYDMLKEIEKLGFVSRSYEVNTKDTGRSQVVFSPTSKATDLFLQDRTGDLNPDDWENTVAKIKGLLANLKNNSINELIRKLLDEIPKQATQVEFCGYIIGLLLAYLKKIGGKTETLIRLILSKTPSRETGIMMFVGTVLGTIIHTINEELGTEVTELVSEFVNTIEGLSKQEQGMLSELLREAWA